MVVCISYIVITVVVDKRSILVLYCYIYFSMESLAILRSILDGKSRRVCIFYVASTVLLTSSLPEVRK
jgi:hypothetical protein